MSLRVTSILLVAVCLAACSSSKAPDDQNVLPKSDPKKQISELLTTTLQDPTNIKDAYISDISRNGSGPYFVCVKFNSRDAERNYKGSEERIAYFYDGWLNQLVPPQGDQCAKAAYKPFPELQKLCQSRERCE